MTDDRVRRHRSGMTAVLMGMSLLFAACGAPGAPTSDEPSADEPSGSQPPGNGAGTDEPVLIGGVGPLSAPGGIQGGQELQWAMEAAVADVNAEGGVLGGRQLELVFGDTPNTPNISEQTARRLVEEENVVAVAGAYHSGDALAMIPVFTEAGIPFVVSAAQLDQITAGDPDAPNLPPNPPTTFRIYPASSASAELWGSYIVEGLGAEKVVQFYEATDFGIQQAKLVKEYYGSLGLDVAQIQVELDQPNYSNILLRAKEEHADADAAIFDVAGESSFVINQGAFDAGLLAPDADTACLADVIAAESEAWWRAVPDGVGCVFLLAGPTPASYNELTSSVADRFIEDFDREPAAWVFTSYDAIRLIADAIERAGSTEPMAIVEALEQTTYSGTLGDYSFPYNSTNPLPEDEPGWKWHSPVDPALSLFQYFEAGQNVHDAAVVWPQERQTHDTPYLEPGS